MYCTKNNKMAYREYKQYLTDREYINLCTMKKTIGKIHRQLNRNAELIKEHEIKFHEHSQHECHLYHSDMLVILGKERRMLKNTRKKIEKLTDVIVKRAQRRGEDIKSLSNVKNC